MYRAYIYSYGKNHTFAVRFKNSVFVVSFAPPSDRRRVLVERGVDLSKHEYRRVMCGRRVTDETLGILAIEDERVAVVCNNKECMERAKIFSLLD